MDAVAMAAQPQMTQMTDALQALAAGQVQGVAEGETGFGEMFAALIQQMAEQTGGEDADLLMALLGGKGTGKDKDDLATMLGMQAMAEGLFTPQMLQMLTQQAGELQIEGGTAAVEALKQLLDPQRFTLWGEMPAESGTAAKTTGDEELDALLETLTAAWQPAREIGETTGDTLEDQLYFQTALRQAQQAVAERPQTQQKTESHLENLEALQQAVDGRQFLAGTSAADPAAPTPTIEQVADQIKTGILQNLSEGRQEFVVRLKPDGMGEIEVRFTEDKNSVSLRIVTSSAAVGRMLADDVAQLQNALRPLNAQVQEIVTVPQANGAQAAQTQLMGEQQQGQYARHYQNEQAAAQQQSEEEFEQLIEEPAPDDTAVNLLI